MTQKDTRIRIKEYIEGKGDLHRLYKHSSD